MTTSVHRAALWAAMPLLIAGCKGEEEVVEVVTTPPAAESPMITAPLPAPVDVTVRVTDSNLAKARADIVSNRMGAANELRQAATALRQEATTAGPERRQALGEVATRLDRLASDVEGGTIQAATDLDREYVIIHTNLAREYHRAARNALARSAARDAGRDIQSAATHLEYALKAAGRDTESASVTIVMDARAVGEKLVQGGQWTAEEVEHALRNMAGEFERLGER